MMGQIRKLLIALAILAGVRQAHAQFTFTTNSDGTLNIYQYTGSGGAVIIPSSTNGLPVTSIAGMAFEYAGVTSVTIPNSVTNIGDYAFSVCPSLTAITVNVGDPDYSSVGGVLFNQSQTTLIEYPQGKTATTYAIPDSVTNIEDYAFLRCSDLASVTIPNSVTNIGDYAFYSCSALASVTIPNSVTNIGDYAFNTCNSLTNAAIAGSGLTSIGEAAFQSCPDLTSLTISNGVTSIGELAFSDCTSLTNVTIPNSVTNIGVNAFYGCSALASVTMGSGLINIGGDLFLGCSSLTAINVNPGNPNYSGVGGVLFNQNQTELIEYSPGLRGSYMIPGSVTSVASSAFAYCYGLTNVTIPNSVTSMGDDVFQNCTGLTSVTIPGSVTSIGTQTFYECQHLTNVTMGSGLPIIGGYAFAYCSDLTSATIPNSVTNIGADAFYDCTSLTNVTIGTNVTSIGESAFYDCTSLTSVMIPNSVASISAEAFAFCPNLAAINVNTGNPDYSSVGGVLFNFNQTTLIQYPEAGAPSYTIPNTVTTIAGFAFEYDGVTSVTIPSSVTSIGEQAFYECASLTSVYFEGNAPSSDDSAFLDYSGGRSYDPATAFYLVGTTGWKTFSVISGLPTAVWSLPAAPRLSILYSGPNVILTWPTNATGYALQSATNLFSPVWSAVSPAPVVVNTNNTVTNGISGPQTFYRLSL